VSACNEKNSTFNSTHRTLHCRQKIYNAEIYSNRNIFGVAKGDLPMCHSTITAIISTSLTASFLFCCACGGKTAGDEEQIKEIIAKAASLAEQHDSKGIMDMAAEHFLVEPQRIDRKSSKQMLFFAFKRYGKFRIHYPTPTIQVDSSGLFAKAHAPFVIVRDGKNHLDSPNSQTIPARGFPN